MLFRSISIQLCFVRFQPDSLIFLMEMERDTLHLLRTLDCLSQRKIFFPLEFPLLSQGAAINSLEHFPGPWDSPNSFLVPLLNHPVLMCTNCFYDKHWPFNDLRTSFSRLLPNTKSRFSLEGVPYTQAFGQPPFPLEERALMAASLDSKAVRSLPVVSTSESPLSWYLSCTLFL